MTDILELPVAYRDACASDLGLALHLPPQDALVVRRVEDGPWSVELRILGASHQVLVTRGGAAICSETVACGVGPGPGAALPDRQDRRSATGHHHFSSRIDRLDPSAFARRVGRLLDGLAGTTAAVCARFPGDETATTGLRLDVVGDHQLVWSGWHSYPRTGEVVTTSSRLVLPSDRVGPLR